jgi:hypothetical protein
MTAILARPNCRALRFKELAAELSVKRHTTTLTAEDRQFRTQI